MNVSYRQWLAGKNTLRDDFVKVVIANFGKEVYPDNPVDYESEWRGFLQTGVPATFQVV